MSPLSFLAPAALAALALAAIPVVVHMLRRAKSRRLEFPSLRFLRETPSVARALTAPKRKALLALRVLVVALVALAFARPVWVGAPPPNTAVVVLLDASASMRRPDARDGALDAARRAISALGPDDTVRVAAFARDVAWLGDAASPRAALETLASYEPGYEAAAVRPALDAAARTLGDRPESSRRIVLISDFQRSNGPWDTASLEPSVSVEPVRVGGSYDNLFIAATRVDVSGPAPTVACSRVRSGASGRELSLVDVPLGGAAAGVAVGDADGGAWRASVLGADGFDADDARYIVPPETGRVLVADPGGVYLSAAAASVFGAATLPATAVTEDTLAPVRRALVTRRALEVAGSADALDRWVKGGGEAVVFGAAPTSWDFPNVVGDEIAAGGLLRAGAGDENRALDRALLDAEVTAARRVDAQPGDRVVLRSASGTPLAVRRQGGAGAVTVVGLELTPANTPLVRRGGFPDLVAWLAGAEPATEIDVGARIPDGSGGVTVARAPGAVRVVRDGRPALVAVNVASAESEPAALGDEEIAAAVRRDATPAVSLSPGVRAAVEDRQRAWWFALAAALALTLFELAVLLRRPAAAIVADE